MARESIKLRQERAVEVYGILDELYPDVGTFLTHETPFQLLIAVILSAQCTDERVNMVTPGLFEAFPDAKALMKGALPEIKEKIKSINFFNNKAQNIQLTAAMIHTQYKGEVPEDLETLVSFPGVGRKTANVVRGQAFGLPGITVDTHVNRLSNRLGFTKLSDPVSAEKELMKVWPEALWTDFSSKLILHGRQVCKARRAECERCDLASYCPKVAVVN